MFHSNKRIYSRPFSRPLSYWQLEELVADAHGLVRLRDRPASIALQCGKRPYCVYVLWDDHAFDVHLIHNVRLAVCHVKDVPTNAYFPHISYHTYQVPHHLDHSV